MRAWRRQTVRRRAAAPPLRRVHVHRVTVIPFDEEEAGPHARLGPALREFLDGAAPRDAGLREWLCRALPGDVAGGPFSRDGLLEALRALRWLHERGAPADELDGHWETLAGATQDQVACLLPPDLAEACQALAFCERRYPELVRLLSQHIRRLNRSFGSADIGLVSRAYSKMGWRSSKTISYLSRQMVRLLRNPETAALVQPQDLAALVGAYPQLSISVGKKKEGGALDLWRAVAVAVPSHMQQMRPRHFTVILNTYARMGFSFTAIHSHTRRMFEACANHLVPRLADPGPGPRAAGDEAVDAAGAEGVDVFSARDVAIICNAYAKVRAGPYVRPLMQAVAARVVAGAAEGGAHFHQDTANVLNAFAMLEVTSPEAFEAAAPGIVEHVATYTAQSLANVAHAYAKHDTRHIALQEAVAQMSLRLLDRFMPVHLGQLAYAFGRLRVRHDEFLSGLRDEVIYRGTVGRSLQRVSSMYTFPLACIGQITQGAARLGMRDQRLYFVLFDMARQREREFARRMRSKEKAAAETEEGGGEANLSLAAKMAIRGECPELLTGHLLSVLVSAFSRSKADFHSFLRWVPRQVESLKGQYTTSQLATIFSSCARLGIAHPPMYKEILQHARPRVAQMSPKALAKLIRGMSDVRMYKRVLMRQAVQVISPRLLDLDVLDLCDLLSGCARLAYRDERFLRVLAAAVRSKKDEMRAGQLASALIDFSHMRVAHHKWYNFVLFELFRRQHELNQRDATKVAKAMVLVAASKQHDPSATTGKVQNDDGEEVWYPFDQHRGIMFSMLNVVHGKRQNLTYPIVAQLQIIELFLRFLVPSVYREMPHPLKVLLAKARRVNLAVDDYMNNSSKMHRDISKCFTEVGLNHRSEVFIGPFMLDMVIGNKVVVEVDGPSHFYRDTNSRTAASLLKSALLTSMGFRVKHLPYQEWSQCGTAAKRTLYCAAFWRDVLAQGEGEPARPSAPLVDIVEMLVRSQQRPGPPASAGAAPPGPAFYGEDAARWDELEARADSRAGELNAGEPGAEGRPAEGPVRRARFCPGVTIQAELFLEIWLVGSSTKDHQKRDHRVQKVIQDTMLCTKEYAERHRIYQPPPAVRDIPRRNQETTSKMNVLAEDKEARDGINKTKEHIVVNEQKMESFATDMMVHEMTVDYWDDLLAETMDPDSAERHEMFDFDAAVGQQMRGDDDRSAATRTFEAEAEAEALLIYDAEQKDLEDAAGKWQFSTLRETLFVITLKMHPWLNLTAHSCYAPNSKKLKLLLDAKTHQLHLHRGHAFVHSSGSQHRNDHIVTNSYFHSACTDIKVNYHVDSYGGRDDHLPVYAVFEATHSRAPVLTQGKLRFGQNKFTEQEPQFKFKNI
ncbi:unnamed protein product [Prorocentrum cordatum]|uniref:RAP domain-containing protein n=1 Tax=Prorocentrum cordatum TaxID=2364126 RepID=A0ABN9U3X1_9DINO|nr:unnamed protein product [Polarella glacialis]